MDESGEPLPKRVRGYAISPTSGVCPARIGHDGFSVPWDPAFAGFVEISLLTVCMALSFDAQRENWLVTLAGVAVVGQAVQPRTGEMAKGEVINWNSQQIISACTGIGLLLLAWLVLVPRERNMLFNKIARVFPVRAADYVREHQMAKPLFNTYRWGSFLIWYLPEYPVAIDGRRDLYPLEEQGNYFKVMSVEISYRDFPTMDRARAFLLDKTDVMGQALREVPGFVSCTRTTFRLFTSMRPVDKQHLQATKGIGHEKTG